MLLPLQPADCYAEVLATADVLVALLEHDASAFSVPSKILTYLTADRPILAAIPSDNLAARTISGTEAGIVTQPGDSAAFALSARNLLADEPMRRRLGENGRRYAARSFAIAPIVDRFERVFSSREPAIDTSQAEALGRADG
jgi:glycosyltransferase involved in cell wall biosynthesis